MGYGFHEDGLKAGLRAARELIMDPRPAAAAQRHRDPRRRAAGSVCMNTVVGSAVSAAQTLIGFGQVRHARSRPQGARLRLPDLLPDAAAAQPSEKRAPALLGTQPLARRWPFTTATTATAATTAWPGSTACWPSTASATRRRGLAAHLPARAGLRVQAGELLVLPPRRRHAARGGRRGQQHLRRAPLLPAGRAALRRAGHGRQGVPRLALLPGARRIPLRLHAHAARRRRPHRGAHRLPRRARRGGPDPHQRQRHAAAAGRRERTAARCGATR